MSYTKRAGLLPYRTSQGTLVYESKRDREAREDRLGGIFFFFRDDEGNIEWPEHWTQTEIDNYYNYIKESRERQKQN